jgi:hypothetical protein
MSGDIRINIPAVRVLRGMTAIGFVKEVGPQTWEATPITREMAKEEIAAGHRMM